MIKECVILFELKVMDKRELIIEGGERGAMNMETNKISEIHARIPPQFIPKVGIEFETEDVAYAFYNSYAYKVGFSIRISKGHKDHDGKIVDRIFCYSCEGYHEKDKRDANVKNPCAQTRFGCLAKIKINSRLTKKFHVIKFVANIHMRLQALVRVICIDHKG